MEVLTECWTLRVNIDKGVGQGGTQSCMYLLIIMSERTGSFRSLNISGKQCTDGGPDNKMMVTETLYQNTEILPLKLIIGSTTYRTVADIFITIIIAAKRHIANVTTRKRLLRC
jgi:hypothetical protein